LLVAKVHTTPLFVLNPPMTGNNFKWLFIIFEHQSVSSKGSHDDFVCFEAPVCWATTTVVFLLLGDDHLCVTEVYMTPLYVFKPPYDG
jgi:hypothetical protein